MKLSLMRLSRSAVFVPLAIVVGVGGLLAADEDLRFRQQSQQRARDMAQELVSRILDLQVRQLEENGLENLQLYRDIVGMQKNIAGLIEAEMSEVVELLREGQEQDDEAVRVDAVKRAREMIRGIVVRLSLERQNLLRRLKTAELAAQVKRVIGLQTIVRDVTAAVPKQPGNRQEALTLSAIQDQRDVKALFLQLVESLSDVSKWGGQIGTGASDGLRILKAASVGKSLDSAAKSLES